MYSKNKLNKVMRALALKRGLVEGIFSANKDLSNTEYHSAFVVSADSIGYKFGQDDDPRPERITMSFFAATAAYLAKVKVTKTDEASALVLTDLAGNFKFAAIIEYHDDNDVENGNWSFVMTFNQDDLKALEKKKKVNKHLYGGEDFHHLLNKVAWDVGSIEFVYESYMYDACTLVIDTLLQILDSEAKVGEIVEIQMPGYFTASVAVEGDEKVFAITPEGQLKEIIKNDVMLEK